MSDIILETIFFDRSYNSNHIVISVTSAGEREERVDLGERKGERQTGWKSDWPFLVSRMTRIKMLPATRSRRRM